MLKKEIDREVNKNRLSKWLNAANRALMLQDNYG
jgi:hypothetical protein